MRSVKCLRCLLVICLVLITFSMSEESFDDEESLGDVNSLTMPYRHIGCFKDKCTRAMSKLLGQWSIILLRMCANASWQRGYEVFGLQYSKECWSSDNASMTYNIYGPSDKCRNGTGGSWANDVYVFYPCPPGSTNTNNYGICRCQACPVDTYKENNVNCKSCPDQAKTWGRKGVDSVAGCSDENPINVSSSRHYISSAFNFSSIVTTFQSSYKKNSLVIPPLVYTITSLLRSNRKKGVSKLGIFKSCSEEDSVWHPFCIYKHNGSILVNGANFRCSEDDVFIIGINVSDSANVSSGIISNSNGSVTLICNDTCSRQFRKLYSDAINTCQENYTLVNVDQQPQLNVNSSNIYAIHRIYLTMESTNQKEFTCHLLMLYRYYLYNITFENLSKVVMDDGSNVLTIIPPQPIEMISDQKTFNISLQCDKKLLDLCDITKLDFMISPRKYGGCKEQRIACLRSVAAWHKSVRSHPASCGNDSLGLWPRHGRCIRKPKIFLGPSDVRRVTSGSDPVISYCNVTSSVPVNITWLRGSFTSQWIVGNDRILSVPAQPCNQSYYWCQATNAFGTTKRFILIVTKDYFTSIVGFKIRRNSVNRGDFNCMQPCRNLLSDRTYLYGSCRHRKLGVTVECTFYAKRNSVDIKSYYERLLADITGGDLEDIQTNTIVLKDAESCIEETTGQDNLQGILKWNSTTIGKTAKSICPFGPQGAHATRKCTGSFLRGGKWKEPNVTFCSFKSQNTQYLNQLKKIKVDNKNAKEVAQNLAKVFKESSSKNLTSADCSLAADVASNIVAIGDRLNETAKLVLDVIDNIMEMNYAALAQIDGATTKIISVLEKVAKGIPMDDGTASKTLITGNLVLQANKVSKSSFKGMDFGVMDDGSIATSGDQPVISVHLPSSILLRSNSTSSRIGFIRYANNKLFQSDSKDNITKLSNFVMCSSVYDTLTTNLREPVRITIPRLKGQDGKSLTNSSCVYWDIAGRKWLGDGCTLCSDQTPDEEDSVQCCCNHLTNFAVLFSPQPIVTTQPHSEHTKILSIITYVGCIISLVAVTLTFLTYFLFRHLRKTNQQPILMNLCVAIALLLIVFVAGINVTDNRRACQVVAVLLHYLTLVTVIWMGIEAYNLYLQIVKVMAIYKSKFMLKAAVVGWGVPFLVVMATLAAAIIQHKQQDGNVAFYYGNDQLCILHNHVYRLVAWFAPVLVILLINLITFFVVLRKLHSTGVMVPVETKSVQRRHCWTAFAIMFLLGLTWLFGAMAISDAKLVFEYFFCIFNSLQGFFIFFFHCVRIKEVRRQWSFFVSGLGFSHRDSQHSYPRSRGIGESHHSSQYNQRVKVKSCTPMDSDAPRKGTMLTALQGKNEVGVIIDEDLKMIDIHLEDARLQSNLTTFAIKKKPC